MRFDTRRLSLSIDQRLGRRASGRNRVRQGPNAYENNPARDPENDELRDVEKLRVLIVDDDAESRASLGSLLARAGMNVVPADSVPAARVALRTFAADVVVSDLIMPEHSGFELVRELRTFGMAGGRQIIAIAISGHPGVRALALEAGFHEYFGKPIDPAALVAAIEALSKDPFEGAK